MLESHGGQRWTSEQVNGVLRPHLLSEGYELSLPRVNGQTGADIVATRGKEKLCIETIGYRLSPPARSKDFYEVFFRAISRIRDGATGCVIALPKQFGVGLPARARQYGEPWARLGKMFPELSIWLVDIEGQGVDRRTWGEWLIA